MRAELVERLRCPQTGSVPRLADGATVDPTGDVLEGLLISADGGYGYPVRNGIPRFVPAPNYAETVSAARAMIEKAGMKQIEALQAGHLVARGVR